LRAIAAIAAAVFLAIVCSTPRVAYAASAPPAFPRIAVWWPDPARQTAADLARCDWIALQSRDADRIAQLRALTPDILVLGSTSARELNYNLNYYNDPVNVEFRSVSTDWMLTQVGSTLGADITASATSIPVADVTRFAAGEMALVDHELVWIEAVGVSGLTVRTRGPVNPPAAHAAGTRIASVVSHWPGSISFDLSAGCPKRDVGYGPETWSDWDIRRGAATLHSADWDGLLIDTLEGGLRWMVTVRDVRSIDPARTNTPVTDGYAAFDAAWYAGAVSYGVGLRTACDDRILISNGNIRNYAINGNIFEQFPFEGLPPATWDTVFMGPYGPPQASYPEWCTYAAAPNLTLIQVYGASNNYRLMRYGLCSALMNDGYFSYALSSIGHARNGIWRFDEYDNAGAGRGYLGQATGSAVRVGGVHRRDYAGGVALVNPSAGPVTVNLGGTFRKIKGSQAPGVNDGTIVTSVKLQARDGIVLLRIPALRASGTTVLYAGQTTLQVSAVQVPVNDVRFEQRAVGAATWTRLATMTPDLGGIVRITRTLRATTEYRAVQVSTGAVSNTVRVAVRPRVTLLRSRRSVRRYGRVVLSGTVGHSGATTVSLQRYVGGTWKTVRRVAVAAAGRYGTMVAFSRRGTFKYRIRIAADGRHLAAVSSVVQIAVR